MDARLTFITLAVADVAASRRFYVDGLGWQPAFEAPGEVMFFRVAPTVMLSLWSRPQFEAEVGPTQTGAGVPPITLAHNMPDRAGVDAYQLDGGILGYFEQVGGDHFTGECFVFDEREALTTDLSATVGFDATESHVSKTAGERPQTAIIARAQAR